MISFCYHFSLIAKSLKKKEKKIYFKVGLKPSWVCNRYAIAKIGVVQIGNKTKRFRLTS